MSRTIALIFLLLNEFEKLFTFIVIQIYNLAINNIDTNTSKTSLSNNIDNLNLFNITFVDNYDLNTKFKNFIT